MAAPKFVGRFQLGL